MSHVDLLWLEARTQNSPANKELVERRIAMQSSLGTPEFFDMARRLKYEINEDYKVRDELGPEPFLDQGTGALASRASGENVRPGFYHCSKDCMAPFQGVMMPG